MEEEDPHIENFYTKFIQKYPVKLDFINPQMMNGQQVRGEFFGVLLSASEDEQKAFAIQLIPMEANVFNDPNTLHYDIQVRLGNYGREGALQEIVNFLRLYVNNPNKSSMLTSSPPATINDIRENMQPRIATALIPKRMGGRRRKTKKSKRRQRKTRRRHK